MALGLLVAWRASERARVAAAPVLLGCIDKLLIVDYLQDHLDTSWIRWVHQRHHNLPEVENGLDLLWVEEQWLGEVALVRVHGVGVGGLQLYLLVVMLAIAEAQDFVGQVCICQEEHYFLSLEQSLRQLKHHHQLIQRFLLLVDQWHASRDHLQFLEVEDQRT